jgi:hypothetical protein
MKIDPSLSLRLLKRPFIQQKFDKFKQDLKISLVMATVN